MHMTLAESGHAARADGRDIALLMTIGACAGPSLTPAGQGIADHADAVHTAEPLPERIAADVSRDSSILRSSPVVRRLLAHPELRAALDRVLPETDLLLARADLLDVGRAANDALLRARTRNVRDIADVRALLGVTVLIRLGQGSGMVTVFEASRGLPESADEAARHARQRLFAVAPWNALLLGFPVVFSPGPGRWISLAFVRGWIKPDVFMMDALGDELFRSAPPHVRDWYGAGLRLPRTIEEFLAGEESAASGQLKNIHGRGI
jgi:hypothetical protein